MAELRDGRGGVLHRGSDDARAALTTRVAASLHRLHRHAEARFAVLHVCVDPPRGEAPPESTELAATVTGMAWVGDHVAELGPGQVVLCVEDVVDEHGAASVARRLVEVLGATGGSGVSVGVVLATADHEHPEDVLAEAAAAVVAARSSGGGYELSDVGLGVSAAERVHLERSLQLALERDEFRVAFQPVLQLVDGAVIGVEALVRWEHPMRGLIPPAAFIAAAEATNLILPIGRWVLAETCRQIAVWRDLLPEVPVIASVNLSAAQLGDPALAGDVRAALSESQVDPSSLCLEVAEGVLMADPATSAEALRSLRAVGVRLAIDDFGTGSSSLSWLERFPVDAIKVDRTFVAGLGRSHVDTAVVRAVIGLGRSLGLRVVAEGIETDEQLGLLLEMGCDAAQGYLWSRPVSGDDLTAFLACPPPPPLAPPVAEGAPTPLAPATKDGDVLDLLVHELRTPLTVIGGYAELLEEGVAAGDTSLVEVGLATVRRQVANIDALLATLVDVQALAAGTLLLRCERVDIGDFVAEVVADLGLASPDRAIELEGAEYPGKTLVDLDVGRIREVLANLVGNAHKFSPPGTPVQVVVERAGREVEIHVMDHGPGIPADRVGDVFRKFARLDRSVKGTGLGLYIARGISRSHGGDLTCRPALGGGADLVLRLPRPAG